MMNAAHNAAHDAARRDATDAPEESAPQGELDQASDPNAAHDAAPDAARRDETDAPDAVAPQGTDAYASDPDAARHDESDAPNAIAPPGTAAQAPAAAETKELHEPTTPAPPDAKPKHPFFRRARNFVAMLALGLVAFITGLIVFNSVVMPRLVHSVNEQRIPDLTNLTVDQAEENLRDRGLALSRAGERFDPSVPRGFILSQDPPPETPIRGKKRVSVVVSLGEEFSSVPELFGESIRTAQYLLERAGLRLGGVTRAPSEEVGEGLVASSDPPAESVLPRDAAVSLLVSTGGGEER